MTDEERQKKIQELIHQAALQKVPTSQINAYINMLNTNYKSTIVDPEEELADVKATKELEQIKSGTPNDEIKNYASGIEQGAFGWEQVPQDKRDEVINYFSSQGKGIPKELSADEKKKQRIGSASLTLIESLEKLYQEAGGGQYSGPVGRLLGKAKSIKGGLGFDAAAKNYEDTKVGFAATLKQLTGDVGVLTNKDYARLAKLIPELGATPEEAAGKFEQLRTQMAASFGVEGGETSVYDKDQTSLLGNVLKGTKEAFIDRPIQNLKNYAQDIGSGIAAPGVLKDVESQRQQAQEILKQAMNESNPRKKQAMFDQARIMFESGSQRSGGLAGEFTEDVNRNPLTRGLEVGADIAGFAQLPSLIKGGVKLGIKGPNALISRILPKSAKNVAPEVAAVVNKPTTLQTLLHPVRTTGAKMETVTKKAGGLTNDILEKKFGSSTMPNPKLYQGTGGAANEFKNMQVVRQEIGLQGRSAGGVVPKVSYSDILERRIGAYNEAFDELAPKAHRETWRRIGNAYSEILHENVPDMKKLDKIFGLTKATGKGLSTVRDRWPYILASIIGWKLLAPYLPSKEE